MTDQQARFIRTLYYDQSCSLQTVARKYYEEFGASSICKDPTAIIYYDNINKKSVYHNYDTDGDITCERYNIIEILFSDKEGMSLISMSDKTLGPPTDAHIEHLEYEDIL
jgi:hypothetical protein